jgi:hypothetical protein
MAKAILKKAKSSGSAVRVRSTKTTVKAVKVPRYDLPNTQGRGKKMPSQTWVKGTASVPYARGKKDSISK